MHWTYKTFPNSSDALSNFKRGVPDGSFGLKLAMDLYRSFAAMSRTGESIHGIYTKGVKSLFVEQFPATHAHQELSGDGFMVTHGDRWVAVVRPLTNWDKRR